MYQLLLHFYMGRLLHLNKNDSVKTIDEIKLMRESAQLVSKTLGMLAKEIKLV